MICQYKSKKRDKKGTARNTLVRSSTIIIGRNSFEIAQIRFSTL